jgi:hypothetical protein
MANSSKRLVTWKQWVLALSAAAIGASLSLYREYRDTGSVQPSSIAISALVFCIGLGIIAVVFWYANRPEKEHNE